MKLYNNSTRFVREYGLLLAPYGSVIVIKPERIISFTTTEGIYLVGAINYEGKTLVEG